LHNFTAIVTVYTHSHPIAKVLYIGSVIKNFFVYHLTIKMLPSKVKNARKIPRYWPRNVGQSPIIELLMQALLLGKYLCNDAIFFIFFASFDALNNNFISIK